MYILGFILVVVVVVLIVPTTTSNDTSSERIRISDDGESKMQSFGLSPTSSLLFYGRRQQQQQQKKNNNNNRRRNLLEEQYDEEHEEEDEEEFLQWQKLMVHPHVSGAYGGLIELSDTKWPTNLRRRLSSDDDNENLIQRHNRLIQNFELGRRYSRYEHHHRQQQQQQQQRQRQRRLQSSYNNQTSLPASSAVPADNRWRQTSQDPISPPPPPQAAVLSGGLLNVYQTAPLSQGYGTHYATVWVGRPNPQRKSVIVDTGSHYTAFPCRGCQNCGEEHHTDAYFDPDLSQTFRQLHCGQCRQGAQCDLYDNDNNNNPYPNQQQQQHNNNNNKKHNSWAYKWIKQTTKSNKKTSSYNSIQSSSSSNNNNNMPLPNHTTNNGRCIFSQSYTEGSSWRAYQAVDRFYCSGSDTTSATNAVDQSFSIDFMFGCQTSETGLFVTQLADGIMGMSAHDATLTKQMHDAGVLSNNLFTLCFRRELTVSKEGVNAGIMTLGGIDTRLNYTPMVYARNVAKSGWYTVYVKNVFLRTGGGQSVIMSSDPNNQSPSSSQQQQQQQQEQQRIMRIPVDIAAVNSGKGIIVDSGTTDTYLHSGIAKSFGQAWKEATGKKYSNTAIKLTRAQLLKLPTVLLQMKAFDDGSWSSPISGSTAGLVGDLDPSSPQDVLLAIPATNYMEYSPTRDTYTSRIYFTESRGGVLGSNAMQGHNVLFDWQNGRIGFAESSCGYMGTTTTTNNNNHHHHDDDVVVDNTDAGTDTIIIDETVTSSFITANSNRDETNNNKSVVGGGIVEKDCRLGIPALSATCFDSMDLDSVAICVENPKEKDTILHGEERWTMLIKSPGTSTGMTCENVITEQLNSFVRSSSSSSENESKKSDENDNVSSSSYSKQQEQEQEQYAETTCDGKGTCTTSIPCQMKCSDINAIHKGTMSSDSKIYSSSSSSSDPHIIMPFILSSSTTSSSSSSSLEEKEKKKERESHDICDNDDATWSACTAQCFQSQMNIDSIIPHENNNNNNSNNNDQEQQISFCRESSIGGRETRPCHIHACGRSDPCRVPFVVHAILVLRGANYRCWSKHYEEVFARALTKTVNTNRRLEDLLFGIGDVNVLLASPWMDDDDEEEERGGGGEEEEEDHSELGMRLVVEISIFNPNARLLIKATEDGDESSSSSRPLATLDDITERVRGVIQSSSSSSHNDGIVPDSSSQQQQQSHTIPQNQKHHHNQRLSTCTESDLYPLARKALDIHMNLGAPTFMTDLIGTVAHDRDNEASMNSPFAPMLLDPVLTEQSQLVTSWTIKTAISGGSGGEWHDHELDVRISILNVLMSTHVLAVLLFFIMCLGLYAWRGRDDRLIVVIDNYGNAADDANGDGNGVNQNQYYYRRQHHHHHHNKHQYHHRLRMSLRSRSSRRPYAYSSSMLHNNINNNATEDVVPLSPPSPPLLSSSSSSPPSSPSSSSQQQIPFLLSSSSSSEGGRHNNNNDIKGISPPSRRKWMEDAKIIRSNLLHG